MDTALFLTLFLFAVQTAAGVAPTKWPQHTWLAGLIFYVSGFFAIVCLVTWAVSNREWLMPAIQPPQIIALGLAIALAGLIFQWRSVPAPDPQIAQLRVEIDRLRADAQSHLIKPNSPTALKPITYNERDIRELLDSLDEASNLLEKRMLPTVISITTAMANWYSAIPNLGVKGTAEQFRLMKSRLPTDVWEPLNALVYDPSNRHPDEMRTAFILNNEATKGELARAMQIAIDALEKLPENPSETTRDLVKPQFAEAYRQSEITYNWMMNVKGCIAQMKTSLKTDGVLGFQILKNSVGPATTPATSP